LRVSRKILREAKQRFPRSLSHKSGAIWRTLLKLSQASAQANSVELIDGEYSDAALRASGTTEQPLAASSRRIGKGSVDNLNQSFILIFYNCV
jgi:hypothetical protein